MENDGYLVKLSKAVFLNHRDLEAFLPGLELFLKYQNSALIRYQLLNFVDKNDGNVIDAKITPLWYFVVGKHC